MPSYKLKVGYAYKSTKRYPRQPQTVIVGETEAASAKFIGKQTIDGTEYCVFRHGRNYYFALTVGCESVTLPYREFTSADVTRDNHIYADRSELIYDAPEWLRRGLQQTASGYGRKLNSGLKISFNGRLYRIYVTCFSNAGSCWFVSNGSKYYVS